MVLRLFGHAETLDANDMRFATARGVNSGERFFTSLRDTVDALHAKGGAGRTAMMWVGLHCRLIDRIGPGANLQEHWFDTPFTIVVP